jgi:hypothetical protein
MSAFNSMKSAFRVSGSYSRRGGLIRDETPEQQAARRRKEAKEMVEADRRFHLEQAARVAK